MSIMNNEDLGQLSELFDVLSKKAPEIISNLIKTVYSPEAGSNMGKAVGNLYKELVESGIPQDVAVKMAGDYMLSIKDVFKNMNFQGSKQENGKEDEK